MRGLQRPQPCTTVDREIEQRSTLTSKMDTSVLGTAAIVPLKGFVLADI